MPNDQDTHVEAEEYEAPEVEDVETADGPAVTSAGADGSIR